MSDYRFEIAFSFAGPHRDKVRAIADIVHSHLGDGRVFFDEWFKHEILGSDMDALLQRIYHDQSLMVVADLSEDYADRQWTQAEARAIRALRKKIDTARNETSRLRLLNIRLGHGEVPGIYDTEGYLDGINETPEECAQTILKRHKLLRDRLTGQPETQPLAVVTASTPIPLPAPARVTPSILFYHPATNDDRYSRRENELCWLDDCAADPSIRIATITGIGGLGKTSLVGHWIQKHHSWQSRPFRGVFFYSFYSIRDPKEFFTAFLKFVCTNESFRLPKDRPLHHLAARACDQWSYLVVLDGLEVLQYGEEDPSHYGWINDGELTEFVARVGAGSSSLLVLTSRFPFPRITDEHPAASRDMELPLFTKHEGADLLAACGLTAPIQKRESYSQLLGGHPLALRLFAGACVEQPFDDPDTLVADLRTAKGINLKKLPSPNAKGISPEESEKRRQRRQFFKLIQWFQKKLTPPQRRLLQLVALFRDPVRTETLVALSQGLSAMQHDFLHCDAADITGHLNRLCHQYLLHQETIQQSVCWSAHPIVRDVFREQALSASKSMATEFAKIVTGKNKGEPRTAADLLPIVEAIDVLLSAGDFLAADELYQERLNNGYVFVNVPAPHEGLRCCRSFLEPLDRRRLMEEVLEVRTGFYLNMIAVCAFNLGDMEQAERMYSEATSYTHSLKDWPNVGIGLCNLAEALSESGRNTEAIPLVSESLFYLGYADKEFTSEAFKPLSKHDDHLFFRVRPNSSVAKAFNEHIDSVSLLASILSNLGRLVAASRRFSAADALARKTDLDHDPLSSSSGIQWEIHCKRLMATDCCRRIADANRSIGVFSHWNSVVAHCDLTLGDIDIEAGDLDSAHTRISGALQLFREAKQGRDLPGALLAMARVRLAMTLAAQSQKAPRTSHTPEALTDDETALSHCEEALRLAARSGLLLKKCDALNLRSLLLRDAGRHGEALRDAQEAHEIATRCEYYWGKHESLRQLRDSCLALGRTAEHREWDAAEKALTQKMAPEIAEAIRITREHFAAMDAKYGPPPVPKKPLKRKR